MQVKSDYEEWCNSWIDGLDEPTITAIAGPPGDASRQDLPVPATLGAGLDPSALQRRSRPATAPALGAGGLLRRALARPCRRPRCSDPRAPRRRLPVPRPARALADLDDERAPPPGATRHACGGPSLLDRPCAAQSGPACALCPSTPLSLRGRPPRSTTTARDERRGAPRDVTSPGDVPREGTAPGDAAALASLIIGTC